MNNITPLLISLLALLLPGCGSYQLRGVVIEGSMPSVIVVDKNDPRLGKLGLASAVVSATLDPDQMHPKPVGSTTTGSAGEFALSIGEGAGFLIYDVQVIARRQGHQTAEGKFPLPKSNQRLLITLPEGQDTWKPQKDIVDETLEMGKPYME